MASYEVPARQVTAEIREKGSRFLAVVDAAAGEEEARAVLAALARRHPGATHLCWAMRLGWPPRERSSDAGEPAGTAGVPMLHALRGAAICDVMAVVVRWCGGVKLGKGGLARAYAAAVCAALAELPTLVRVPTVRLALAAPLDRIGAVKRLLHPPEVELESEDYGALGGAKIVLRVEEGRRAGLEEALAGLHVKVELAADRTARA